MNIVQHTTLIFRLIIFVAPASSTGENLCTIHGLKLRLTEFGIPPMRAGPEAQLQDGYHTEKVA
jgi:hypothetical protein